MNALASNRATGALASSLRPQTVMMLGDGAYPAGTVADYRRTYAPTAWGTLKPITRPVPGNHDYRTSNAAGYFTYFADPPPYYAYDMGCGWRAYALNSEIGIATQTSWLRRDLSTHPAANVLAYWHRPRYSSGSHHGGDPRVQPFWNALAGRKGVVLNGHEHNYERFAPVGRVREFVVGTAGSATYPFRTTPTSGSQRRITGVPGVLRLTLTPGAYAWSFRNVRNTALDSGSGN
jgi:hypothetical protein